MRPSVITATLLAPSLITIIALLAAPMLLVVVYSFAGRDDYGGVVAGFTLQNYVEALQPIYWPVLINTLVLAFWSTVICLVVGYPIAYFIAFKAGRHAPLLMAMLLIPFWVNFLVRISAWMVLLGRNGPFNQGLLASGIIEEPLRLLGTYGAVLMGMLYAFLPAAVLPIYAALNPIDRRLLEAAADLGAGPIEAFWRTTFPLSLPGVMAAILFVFVPAMGVYAIPVLLGGGKSIILGNLIVQLFLEFRNMPLGAAISVILLCVSMLVIAVYMRILNRIEEKRA